MITPADKIIFQSSLSNIVSAIRELTEAVRELSTTMKPAPIPESEPVVYTCPNCGSPNWIPGGMGLSHKKCSDCNFIGEII
jgi:hypothetical protein